MDNLKKVLYESCDKLFEGVYKMDELKRKLVANLQNYLRERMDFIASLPTMDPLWTAQFDIIDNLINPILDDIRDERLNPLNKCPNLFLLFDGILRSEGIRAGGIEFEIKIFKSISPNPDYTWTSEFKLYKQIKYEINKEGNETEFSIAISLGTSGIQAFYGILENIIRNSGRHSNKDEIRKVVEYSDAIKKKKLPSDNSHPLKITIEFWYDDWGNNFKENKDDFVRVKIYDNMGGWIWRAKENNWVKKGNEKFSLEQLEYMLKPEAKKFDNVERDGRIINESGNIVQGSWGMKEMRICASFLRGFKISDYEQVPKDAPPTITPFIQPSDEKNGSLGFEFYIPKVKNLLIVSSKINKENLKKIGIYIEEDISKIIDLQNRGVFTHEFVAIDVDDEENKKFIQENSLLLPYKLFFISGKNENLDEIINLFKKIRYDLYTKDLYIKNSISDTEKENLKNLIISKDDLQQWLTQNGTFEINNVKYQNSPPSERVYLEIYKRWNNYLNLTTTHNFLPKLTIYPSNFKNNPNLLNSIKETGNYNEDELIFLCDTINDEINLKESILLVHRWGVNENVYLPIVNKGPLAILPFAGGISAKATKIAEYCKNEVFQHLTRNKPYKFHFYKYFMEAIESGLLNIIIIDERIFDEAKNRRNICGININFALNWYLQNVVILNLDKENNNFILKGYKVNPLNFGSPFIYKEIKFSSKLSSQNNEIKDFFPKHFENKVHFMIIHQNIIAPKIGGKKEFEKFISFLPNEYKPWYVIITSGRGHPSKNDMPENTKFLDFSSLRSSVIDYPDKFLLTKMLAELKEKNGGI